MKHFWIFPRAIKYVIIFSIVTLGTLDLKPVAIVSFLLLLSVLFFYRSPKRQVAPSQNIILSVADGVITDITDISEDAYIEGEGVKVCITSSITDVHVTRIPISGEVTNASYRKGNVFLTDASTNQKQREKYTIGIQGEKIRLLVHQMSGFFGKRIFSWIWNGHSVQQGEISGHNKYGACYEMILPKKQVDIVVTKGDRVQAGLTTIGVVKYEI
ncbi:phosphatidylserine decarboxylase [Geosporobacter ferrireducens]|uniref:Phosphatidylserine decarboxylase n=1 Tax=Geosporobacter ferrireducens TaxID=1424294 RepID=A0A1D8GNA4_9FIRM|nr:phosphatidylserine decarboxylase [Geosporobacter ferrireducens]AOT72342.1 hypothetical protein Gferi_24015 [Geosporobacter ferrireducens]MTI56403.1 phosphatidylserine decarboxylase family protein [Geosporobacter ferrireducens]